MADSKKSSGGSSGLNSLFEANFLVLIVFFLLIGFFVVKYIPDNLTVDLADTGKDLFLLLPEYLVLLMTRLFSFSLVLSLLLMIIIVWSANGLVRIRNNMHEALNLPKQEKIKLDNGLEQIKNEKWEKVLGHINSTNPSDWKLAILECDIMLAEILERMGYLQESIGEKLKAVEPSDFTNVEAAWEAHKIRNQIAHEGSDFLITEREAKRVIGLYELVFREFEYI